MGKFLGYVVSHKGIEANPAKIQAILDMLSLKSIKDIQKLVGRIANLNQFVCRSTNKCLPFFKLFRNITRFAWNDHCEKVFSKLKAYLSSPPLLVNPKLGDKLYMYLAALEETLITILVKETSKGQLLVYYISKELHDLKLNYNQIEKLAY